MYHKDILLKIWFVAFLSLQIFSTLRIIIKGLEDIGYRLSLCVFWRQKILSYDRVL